MKLMLQIFLWLSGLSLTAIGVQCQSLTGTNMIVTTILDTPYTMLRETSQSNLTGNGRYEGYTVDLLEAISKMLNFNYVLKVNEAGMYGSMDRNGKWNGLIGELVDGKSHVAAGAMTITAEREKVVDFTVPFMNLGIGVIHKGTIVPTNGFDDFTSLVYPFNNYPTDAFLILTLVFGIVLLVLRRKYKSTVFRTLLGVWLLFLFIFASLFIAQLSSYYTLYQRNAEKNGEFNTVEELASQSQVVYGCVAGGATQSFFRNAKSPIYSKMWSRMSSMEPSPFVGSTAEGIERVQQGGYAFVAESTSIEYATARHCDLYQVGDLLDSKGFGLAVQQGSSIRELLSGAILALQEQGVLSSLKEKWWTEKRGGGAC